MLRAFRPWGFLQRVPSVRAVLLLSSVMILATVVSATAVLLDLRQKELLRAKGEMVSLTRILSEQTTRTFEGVALMLSAVRERLSDDIGKSLELDSLPVHLLLRARSAGLPQVKSIFLVDRQGFGVNSSRADFIRQLAMKERAFFRHFVDGGGEGIYISPPEKARIDGQWAYYVSIRLLDGEGQFRGVLVAAINIPYFESLYDSIGLNSVSRIMLLNQDGAFLAGQPHDEAMFGKISVGRSVLEQLRRLPDGGVIESLDEGRGFVAYRQVAKYPLIVRAAIDEDEALAPWRQVVSPLASGVVAVLLFVLITSWLMVRSLLRKDALESTLKQRDEQLRHMVQSVKDAIITVNAARCIMLFNDAAARMFGVPSATAIGREIDGLLADCLDPGQLMSLQRYLEEGWQSPVGLAMIAIFELRSGEQSLPVELSLTTTSFHGEVLLTAVFRDLSERQRAERELLETNRQLQALSAALQHVREEERTRIARELHDELGQLLTGIRMEISWLGGRLTSGPQALVDKVSAVKGQIDQTIVSVRRISSELRPLVLDDLGFSAAANWFVDQFSARTGIKVHLQLPAGDPAAGDAVSTALFRVLQESLTNVARHAQATQVEVTLRLTDGVWMLSVKDDGVGFVHDRGKTGEIGLVGMRERAQNLGGHFTVTTAPGEGTLIEVWIPAEKTGQDQ